MNELSILTVNGMDFVVGLQWNTITRSRNYMKRVKEIGKESGLDVVAIRDVDDSIQAGYAKKNKNTAVRRCYSFALSLIAAIDALPAEALPDDEKEAKRWIGVFPFNETSYVLVASSNGTVIPWTDKLITTDKVNKEVNDLKSRLAMEINGDGKIIVFGPADIDLVNCVLDLERVFVKELLTKKWFLGRVRRKDLVLRPLTFGLTKKQLIGIAGLTVLLIIGLVLLKAHNDKLEAERLRAQALARTEQERINKEAKHKALLENMRHPWIDQPSVNQFVDNCDRLYQRIDLSLKGWKPTRIDCGELDRSEPKGEVIANIKYIRPDNSAVGILDFKQAVLEKYGVRPTFSYQESTVASIALKVETPPNGDDPLGNIDERIDKLITVLQHNNIIPSLKSLPVPETKLDIDGTELPKPKWLGVNFEFSSHTPTRMILKADEENLLGVRLISISATINDGSMQYLVKGIVYGN